MSIFKCKMCGGTIEFEQGSTVGICDSCGTKQTLPKLDDDRRANLYDRANHFRRNNEFDKAMGMYESILNEDNTDAEAYWSLVLCRYGIEYVEDPSTHKRVPTVNRAQFTSIFDDDNYKSALQYADGYQRSIYEEEANTINEIQKGILAISQKEEPFDVFICYKETDSNGRRTQDSVLANDLYHQLTTEGFKVFFARITLEDKLGTAYEPYIFAALNSAKVMVVLGTKPEYFNAVWVKNEWSRYLSLVKQSGGSKILIPAYRDMDPYDLPEEFSHLQAQDMSKLGFMQDLIRGIKKIITAETAANTKETVVVTGGNSDVAPLLKRAFMYLEDGDFKSADEYCERVLDIAPENSDAYLGKLLAEFNVTKEGLLPSLKRDFSGSKNYQKAVRFGNDRLETLNKKAIYNNAMFAMTSASNEETYKSAAKIFGSIAGFEDSDKKAEECLEKAEIARKDAIYSSACGNQKKDTADMLEKAARAFSSISGWKDSDERAQICRQRIKEINQAEENKRMEAKRKQEEAVAFQKRENKKIIIFLSGLAAAAGICALIFFCFIPALKYSNAEKFFENGQYDEAIEAFAALGVYKDSTDRVIEVSYIKAEKLFESGQYDGAIDVFSALGDYKDSANKITEAKYSKAVKMYEDSNFDEALEIFSELNYSERYDNIKEYKYQIAIELFEKQDFNKIKNILNELGDYKESKKYYSFVIYAEYNNYFEAYKYLEKINSEEKGKIQHIVENIMRNITGTYIYSGNYGTKTIIVDADYENFQLIFDSEHAYNFNGYTSYGVYTVSEGKIKCGGYEYIKE